MSNEPDQVDASETTGAAEAVGKDSTRSPDDQEERPEGDLNGEPEEGLDDEDQPARSGATRVAAPVAVWIAIILIGLGVFALLRVAGEQRYQSCVAAAAARSQGATDTLTRFARLRAIQRCSHSPF
jgi:hypothetical protein